MTAHDDTETALAVIATSILTCFLIGGFIFWLYWSDRDKRGNPKKPNGEGRARKKRNAPAKQRRPR
jgi:hypothetical protein